jgi:hypothetical protein
MADEAYEDSMAKPVAKRSEIGPKADHVIGIIAKCHGFKSILNISIFHRL